jgi:hypothetical protein
MALASKHLAVFQPHHARATTPRGTCTAAGGLDAETLRGFQLAGELFSLTSFFIEPKARPSQESLRKLTRTSVGEAFGASSPALSARRECPYYASIGRFDKYWLGGR